MNSPGDSRTPEPWWFSFYFNTYNPCISYLQNNSLQCKIPKEELHTPRQIQSKKETAQKWRRQTQNEPKREEIVTQHDIHPQNFSSFPSKARELCFYNISLAATVWNVWIEEEEGHLSGIQFRGYDLPTPSRGVGAALRFLFDFAFLWLFGVYASIILLSLRCFFNLLDVFFPELSVNLLGQL